MTTYAVQKEGEKEKFFLLEAQMKAKTERIARGGGNNCILTYLMLQHEGRTAKKATRRGRGLRGEAFQLIDEQAAEVALFAD